MYLWCLTTQARDPDCQPTRATHEERLSNAYLTLHRLSKSFKSDIILKNG